MAYGGNDERYANPTLISQYQNQYSRNRMSHDYSSLTSLTDSGASVADARARERQAYLNRLATKSAIAEVASDAALYSGASAAMSAAGMAGSGAGLGGAAMSFLGPAALAAIPIAFAGKTINDYSMRQRSIHSIASDFDTYRGRMGFNRPLSYNESTGLGASMYSEFGGGGGFFNRSQQEQIHKIGLSNDLLSARGSGTDSGSIEQYKNNFQKLKSTTEDIVKLMKTTIKGGMGIIKEMKNLGYGSLDQISGAVKQTQGYGNVSGMGYTNMLSSAYSGASYANNVNPYWRGATGASMYQTNAMAASSLVSQGGAGASAVRAVGGVANAGGTLARIQMENMQGSAGTRYMAYVMKADGTIDEDKLNNLVSGNVGAYDIVSGSNQAGYNLGPSGRALFSRNKRLGLEGMTDIQRSKLDQTMFDSWSTGRYGSREAKAWVYSGLKTSNVRDRELYNQSLLNPRGYDRMHAATQLQGDLSNEMSDSRTPWLGRRMKDWVGGTIQRASDWGGKNVLSPLDLGYDSFTGAAGEFGRSMGGRLIRATGLVDDSYTFGDQYTGNYEAALKKGYGLTGPLNRGAAVNAFNKVRGDLNFNQGSGYFMPSRLDKMSSQQLSTLSRFVTTGVQLGEAEQVFNNSEFLKLANLSETQADKLFPNQSAMLQTIGHDIRKYSATKNQAYKSAESAVDDFMNNNKNYSDTQKQSMLGRARQDYDRGFSMTGHMDEFKTFFDAQKRANEVKDVAKPMVSNLRGVDTKNLGKGMVSFFDSISGSSSEFAKKYGSMDNPQAAMSLFDEYLAMENLDPLEGRTPRQSSLLKAGGGLIGGTEYNRLKKQRMLMLGGEEQDYRTGTMNRFVDYARSSNAKFRNKNFIEDVENAYIKSNEGLDASYFRKNARDLQTLTGVDDSKFKTLKHQFDGEDLMFNEQASRRRLADAENLSNKKEIYKVASAIISESPEITLMPVGKNKEGRVLKQDQYQDVLNAMLAKERITQQNTVTTSNLGKSITTMTQPPVLNYWNNKWS